MAWRIYAGGLLFMHTHSSSTQIGIFKTIRIAKIYTIYWSWNVDVQRMRSVQCIYHSKGDIIRFNYQAFRDEDQFSYMDKWCAKRWIGTQQKATDCVYCNRDDEVAKT